MLKFLLILLGSLVSCPVAWGADYRLLEPTKLTMEYYRIGNNRDEYLRINDQGSTQYAEDPGEIWSYGAAVKFNLDLVSFGSYGLYWDNNVHMAATNSQVRQVGWEFETGAHFGPKLDFYYYHHSQHVLDDQRVGQRYPLINEYGVRFIFIEEGRK